MKGVQKKPGLPPISPSITKSRLTVRWQTLHVMHQPRIPSHHSQTMGSPSPGKVTHAIQRTRRCKLPSTGWLLACLATLPEYVRKRHESSRIKNHVSHEPIPSSYQTFALLFFHHVCHSPYVHRAAPTETSASPTTSLFCTHVHAKQATQGIPYIMFFVGSSRFLPYMDRGSRPISHHGSFFSL